MEAFQSDLEEINPNAVEITKSRLNFKVNNAATQTVAIGDVRRLNKHEGDSVDLIVTHPPYSNIVTYSDRKNPDDLSSIAGIPKFLDELEVGIRELFRVLKPNRYCAILIGDTRKGQHYVPLSYFVLERCLRNGFALKEEIIKTQHNTKYGQRWKDRAKSFQFYLIMHEHLFVFRKPKPDEDLSRIRYSILRSGALRLTSRKRMLPDLKRVPSKLLICRSPRSGIPHLV